MGSVSDLPQLAFRTDPISGVHGKVRAWALHISAMMARRFGFTEIRALGSSLEDIPDLVQRIGAGDSQAEDELVRHYVPTVRLILLRRTRNPQLANDLCQDTLVIVLRRLRAGELRDPLALSAFIHRTAVNLSIEHFRYEKRFVHLPDEIISRHGTQSDAKVQHIDQIRARKLIDAALAQLGMARDREILKRYFLQDEDKEAICQVLDLTADHFDLVLHRAKQRMRKLIEKQAELKSILLGSYQDG